MKTQSNSAANVANNSNNWKNEVNEIRARLEAIKPRSCLRPGVQPINTYINKVRRVTANRHTGSDTPARHNNVKYVAY